MNKICNTRSFFASANTFDGFDSNFKKVFNNVVFERIYILKGGPGTGKSTLMRKLGEIFASTDASITYIYCSSDPNSLDGIIIDKNDKKVAVLDGTAPHTTDPAFPGAVEEIINLGDGFDTQALKSRKKDIISINMKKSVAYKRAYRYLALAGNIYDEIQNIIVDCDIYSEAESIADEIMRNVCESCEASEVIDYYLVSAFGKNGYTRLDIPCIKKDYISVVGDGFTEQVVMNILKKKLGQENTIEMIAFSALTKRNIDAIFTDSYVISTDNVGNMVYDTQKLASCLPEEYSCLVDMYCKLLELAKSAFSDASNHHFELEKIYTESVDFNNNDKVIQRLKREIPDYLS